MTAPTHRLLLGLVKHADSPVLARPLPSPFGLLCAACGVAVASAAVAS